jgi:hypothetical protein
MSGFTPLTLPMYSAKSAAAILVNIVGSAGRMIGARLLPLATKTIFVWSSVCLSTLLGRCSPAA